MSAARRAADVALAALPAALVVYLAFRTGGYFPDDQGLACIFLGFALVARLLLSERPFAGISRWTAVACGALAGFAAWTLLSAAWSDASGRALLEFNRALLYLLALAFFGSFLADVQRLRMALRWLGLAFVVVAAGGLISKLLPDLLPLSPGEPLTTRLSYPFEYWNALGLACAIGAVLLLHLTTEAREHLATRVLSAAGLPVLASALLLTFSRGAILALAIAVIAYLILARPRGIAGLLAVAGPVVFVVIRAYDEEAVADAPRPLPAPLRDDAESLVLTILAACAVAAVLRLAVAPVDRRLAAWTPPRLPRAALPVTAVVLALGVAGGLAAGAGGELRTQWDRFLEDERPSEDVQSRLADPSPTGRLEQWEIGLDGLDESWAHGAGAGTYEWFWYRARDSGGIITDGHSLYFEQLGELGVVGFALLVLALLTILVRFATRRRGPDRSLHAALLAAGIAWALHAGLDWDWEMPAVTIWLFCLGGFALARAAPVEARSAMPYGQRLALAVQLAALMVVPGLVALSQARFDEASAAFARGDCATAAPAARESLDYVGVRAGVYELLGYCSVQQEQYTTAVDQMREAVRLDPKTWDYRYALALALASAGQDPREEIARAARMNPRDPLVRDARALFATDDPRTWRRWGRRLATRLREL